MGGCCQDKTKRYTYGIDKKIEMIDDEDEYVFNKQNNPKIDDAIDVVTDDVV